MLSKSKLKNLAIFFAILTSIYCLFSLGCVIDTLYSGFTASSNLQQNLFNNRHNDTSKYVIGIISPYRGGELNQAIMVKEAANRLGYSAYVFPFNDLDTNMFLPAKYINTLLIKLLDYVYKTDFHLAMSFHMNIEIDDPKIMYISVPERYVLEQKKFDNYPNVKDFSNFLDINLINTNYEMMNKLIGHKVNSAYGMVGFPATKFKSSSRQKLLMYGSLWGRKTDNFYQAVNELAMQDYMYFIKSPSLLLNLKFKQKFTEKAPNLIKLLSIINEYGIALCTHSRFHIEAGIPSSRIFEIISSGAIAISDMNPFVIKYFGDNVLYFDQTASSEEIFNQINDHVHWVQTHPKEAEEKAKNAHKILQEKFTTEIFVKDLVQFYEKVYQ